MSKHYDEAMSHVDRFKSLIQKIETLTSNIETTDQTITENASGLRDLLLLKQDIEKLSQAIQTDVSMQTKAIESMNQALNLAHKEIMDRIIKAQEELQHSLQTTQQALNTSASQMTDHLNEIKNSIKTHVDTQERIEKEKHDFQKLHLIIIYSVLGALVILMGLNLII